ncbi:granulin 1 [Pristis pectinata]|uniref:granulin 1 n=1 Tax=Pristis pectinata TaxID=685728 RepID=UPI00223E1135|nr:granulin 1 [Pristis pectinata]
MFPLVILLLPSLASAAQRCPDGGSCPNESTCCKLQTGNYGCCPLEETVCCFHGLSCCPADYKRDITPSFAALKDLSNPVEGETLKKMEVQSNSVSNDPSRIYCDNVNFCPDGHTCCRLQDGNWGCCPHPEAECCKDGAHCCPRGTKCDTESSKCHMDSISIPWLAKKPALTVSEAQQNCNSSSCPVVQCDDTHVCKAGSTCCKMANHQWGCCPYPKAHCCWDGKHCCPRFHWCDNRRNLCRRWWLPHDWSQLSSIKYGEESENF